MSVMKRLSLIFRAKANKALDRAEDPRETLDYSYERTLEMLQKMRMQLAHQIISTPLRRLEEFGGHRLLAVLTDDVNTISNSLLCIPHILINSAILVGCLLYLAWLSPTVLLALLAFMAVGFVSYRLPDRL